MLMIFAAKCIALKLTLKLLLDWPDIVGYSKLNFQIIQMLYTVIQKEMQEKTVLGIYKQCYDICGKLQVSYVSCLYFVNRVLLVVAAVILLMPSTGV